MFRLSLVVTTICLAFSFSTSAMAAKPPSNEQLFEMVKALQSRVAVLEKQNAGYQRELISVQRDAEQPQLASLTRSADEPKPMRLANPTGGALQPADNWSGMYWGASFGAGVTSSKAKTVRSNGTSPVPKSGDDDGAIIDLFFGVNRQFGSRLVGGVQLEGSLGAIDLRNREITPLIEDNMHAVDWMASIFARAGYLMTPSTMIYGLAGWTYADVDTSGTAETNVRGFNMDGITIGGGIERSISPDWTIRGEYRFTDLDTGSSTDAFGNTFSLDGDMHIGRIGIARKLGRSEPSAEALK